MKPRLPKRGSLNRPQVNMLSASSHAPWVTFIVHCPLDYRGQQRLWKSVQECRSLYLEIYRDWTCMLV